MNRPLVEWRPLPPPEPTRTYTLADWVDAIAVGAVLAGILTPIHYIIT